MMEKQMNGTTDVSTVCDSATHFHRRTLLGWSAGGCMMSMIAKRLALADQLGGADAKLPRNVILLWLEGGPSQLETFDPHPDRAIGGDTKAIHTSLRGTQLSSMLPQVAQQMHLCSLVRSVTGDEGEHRRAQYHTRTGFRPAPALKHPSIGSILCSQDQQRTDIPRHVSILAGDSPSRGGYLGAAFDAFQVGDPASPVADLRSRVDDSRMNRRTNEWLSVVETEFARGRLAKLETQRTLHLSATERAMRMMSSDQVSAFDVSDEPKAVQEAFGNSAFGRGCIAASRLIQAGTRCVEVTLSGWDSHVANHSLHQSLCQVLDPALSSLLVRLQDRDLLDSTLVVCAGEFGRTPQINPAEGRDHWPHGFSVLMAGCEMRRGFVFGQTSPTPKLDPTKPLADVADPVTVEDIHATILAALRIDHEFEVETPSGRPIKRSEGKVIHKLLDV